ncbi:peptidase inhibitor family I36 protein [Saccharothrix obliqua]|uniref:peptidase inhibitor family I36 protein n=1 Tax=Saccharothrix obliqua TaxID=2861747 RepID=UPI001C5DC7DF|nr:peptidase inhibitor family I36 protein [Saccharothrix obliqua]MBW4721368.1 peptidase inhibitor family I36 protein [Saccharothrix obliqua]
MIFRVLAVLLLAIGFGVPSSALAAPVPGWNDCPSQHVCFWSNDNGTGSMCKWSGDDRDWHSGEVVCSWSKGTKAESVYNRGTSGRSVSYYTGANYGGSRGGCTAPGTRGNFAGNNGTGYLLRSHKWEC